MRRITAIATAVLISGCATEPRPPPRPPRARAQVRPEELMLNYALTIMFVSMREDVKEYAHRILVLPQPQKAENGREFEAKYHIKLQCAFDENHPPNRPEDEQEHAF